MILSYSITLFFKEVITASIIVMRQAAERARTHNSKIERNKNHPIIGIVLITGAPEIIKLAAGRKKKVVPSS